MKRLLPFLRSVLPADPWQLVLLMGSVLIFISHRLDWYPSFNSLSDQPSTRDLSSSVLRPIATLPLGLTLAGLCAYFICFYPGMKPVRRFVWLVFLPGTVALGLVLWAFFEVFRPSTSVFHPRSTFAIVFEWLRSNFGALPQGLHFGIAGLVLIGAFVVRLGIGRSSLPLTLPVSSVSPNESHDSSRKTLLLTFVLIAPLFVAQNLVSLPLAAPYFFLSKIPPFYAVLTRIGGSVIASGVLVALAVLILGADVKTDAQRSLSLPRFHQFVFALFVPVALSFFLSLPSYVLDRTNWAIYSLRQDFAPVFRTYFDFDGLHDPWLLLLALGAFAEEFVFRGLLLRRLIFRYGFHRGVFLTGVVWAAYHFRSDSYRDLSASGVLLHLAYRIMICLAMNYVLAWMTLRWNSILPAGIAHTVYNVLVIAGVNAPISWVYQLLILEWAVLAFLLFRYRPIRNTDPANPESAAAQLDAEPAV